MLRVDTDESVQDYADFNTRANNVVSLRKEISRLLKSKFGSCSGYHTHKLEAPSPEQQEQAPLYEGRWAGCSVQYELEADYAFRTPLCPATSLTAICGMPPKPPKPLLGGVVLHPLLQLYEQIAWFQLRYHTRSTSHRSQTRSTAAAGGRRAGGRGAGGGCTSTRSFCHTSSQQETPQGLRKHQLFLFKGFLRDDVDEPLGHCI